MVRGILFKLEFPYAHFGTRGVTADTPFPTVWEAIHQLDSIGCKVICMVPAQIELFFCMHGKGKDLTYKTHNSFADLKEKR